MSFTNSEICLRTSGLRFERATPADVSWSNAKSVRAIRSIGYSLTLPAVTSGAKTSLKAPAKLHFPPCLGTDDLRGFDKGDALNVRGSAEVN
jgi:hypothetical protein